MAVKGGTMSRPKYYWYTHVRRTVENYPHRLQADTEQGRLALSAIEKVIESTKAMQDGEDRIKLINMLYWRKSHTIDGAAHRLHISNRTAWRWVKRFIYDVAREMGFI